MAKIVRYLGILIFLDLFFVITGQICNSNVGCSLTSIVFNSLLDIGNITSSQFFTQFVGSVTDFLSSTTGFLAIGAGAAVLIGSLIIPSEVRFFIPIAFTLSLLATDFVFIATYLFSLNVVLGSMIMIPMILLYTFTVVEWLKNKD